MNNKQNLICPYQHYYSRQAGTGVGIIYRGVPYQRGHGIGSFLGGLFRSVFPLLKSGAKAVGTEALNAGMGLISDMINARPLNESVKTHLKNITTNLKRKADNKIDSMMSGSGSGYKTRRLTNKVSIRKKLLKRKGAGKNKKRDIKDIFV